MPVPLTLPFSRVQRQLGLTCLMLSFILPTGTAGPMQTDARQQNLQRLLSVLTAVDAPEVQKSLLQGIYRGLEGQKNIPVPPAWPRLATRLALSNDDDVRHLTQQLSQIFGDPAAIRQALQTVHDESADPARRRSALRALLEQSNQEASFALEVLLDDSHLKRDAIRGYALVENAAAPAVLLQRYPDLDADHRRAVLETLSSRKRYAIPLLAAVRSGEIRKSDVPPHVVRTLHSLLPEPTQQVFGPVKELAADRQQMMAKYRQLLTPKALADADPRRGRAVFKKTCANCHLLYGEGGKIGPDLTGSNRANLDYILLNSIDPSYDVPEGYRMHQIVTTEGRLINGVLAEEDDVRVVLKTVEQPRVVIAKTDIEDRRVSDKSMMPERQFDALKPQEVIDLIRYLRTTEQVDLPE